MTDLPEVERLFAFLALQAADQRTAMLTCVPPPAPLREA
jgi:hypothetical protein